MKQLISILARAADGAMLVDPDRKVVFWNQAAERLLGYKSAEVVGRFCYDVLRGETLRGQTLCSPSCAIGSRLACGEAVQNFNMQTRAKNGRLVWLNVSCLPVPARKPGRSWSAHLFRNITGQAKVQQLIEELHAAVSCPGPAEHEAPIEQAPDIPPALPLSGREREVLQLIAQGKNTRSIANSLCISPATARNHIQHILEKLGAHSRLQALAIAFHPSASPH